MGEKLLSLVIDSQALNSKIISLPRLLILSSLAPFAKDGSMYRELKAALSLEEGVLFSNLKILEELGYIIKKEEKVENKTITAYTITEQGQLELNKVRKWFEDWVLYGSDKNEK